MSPTVQQVQEQALKLTEAERAKLASVLLESLPESMEFAYDPEYLAEIRRRIDDVESGRVKTIPWATVQREIREKLDARRNA